MNLDFLASSSVTSHCICPSSYLVVEKNVVHAELFHWPACAVQSSICCLQFGDLSFTWFSFCRGATLDLSVHLIHRYLCNF